MSKIRVLDTIDGTTVDGPGFRTSTYFSGCSHRCPGCHNPQSWDYYNGTEWEVSDYYKQVIEPSPWNVTFSGGDPIYQFEGVLELATLIKSNSNKTIWLYTGYTIEHLMDAVPAFRYDLAPLLEAVVDGPFHLSERNTDLLFRGSNNQRIVYLTNTDDRIPESMVYSK